MAASRPCALQLVLEEVSPPLRPELMRLLVRKAVLQDRCCIVPSPIRGGCGGWGGVGWGWVLFSKIGENAIKGVDA
jgi:hypothetical protein